MSDAVAWLEGTAQAPWTITFIAVVCAFIIGRLVVQVARPVLARIAGRTATEWDDQLGASSLDIEIMAWFQTTEWAEFQAIRQDVLLDFMAAIERHGSSIAFPTRTVHVATAAPAALPDRR